MKGVQEILEHLGYGEIRLEGSGPNGSPQESKVGDEWAPLSNVNGRFGTTDETEIIRRKESPTARLVDSETGELVATARKSCSIAADGGRN
jgi:hypothetical protein